MSDLEKKVTDPLIKGQKFVYGSKVYIFKQADNFEYCDPIDKSVTTKQVIQENKKKLLSCKFVLNLIVYLFNRV